MGLGPSIVDYKGEAGLRFGVNDIFKRHEVDHLVVQNFPDQFEPGRQYWIRRARPQIFHSSVEAWKDVPNWKKMDLLSPRGKVDFKDPRISYSVFSPFSCLDLAVKMGASRILVFGVDIIGHPVLGEERKVIRVLRDLEGFLEVCPVPVHWAPSSPLALRLVSPLASSGGGVLPSR